VFLSTHCDHRRPHCCPTRRSSDLAKRVPGARACAPQEVADRVDIAFLTVPDDAIAAVASSLRWRAGSACVHCSGAADLDVLKKRSEEHTSELQSRFDLVCRLLLEN